MQSASRAPSVNRCRTTAPTSFDVAVSRAEDAGSRRRGQSRTQVAPGTSGRAQRCRHARSERLLKPAHGDRPLRGTPGPQRTSDGCRGNHTLLDRVHQLEEPAQGLADDLLRQSSTFRMPRSSLHATVEGSWAQPSWPSGRRCDTEAWWAHWTCLPWIPKPQMRRILNTLLGQIVRSAHNKGCVEIEVEDEAGVRQPWLGWGFHEAKPHLALEVAAGALRP